MAHLNYNSKLRQWTLRVGNSYVLFEQTKTKNKAKLCTYGGKDGLITFWKYQLLWSL